ncbi:molecular chaperone [Paenibacillus illinoisensis]|uniref:molecular chaperone n=1 Tax=Paenibacillus illinoisensis TaxID=59845 RepID=UPI000FDC54A3|nr:MULTISPECIES: molecular chaperone [Paenibacillus]
MNGYSYRLYPDATGRERARGTMRYTREELMDMTTFQLRNICYKERLVEGLGSRTEREELIRIILKFLGADDVLWIDQSVEGGFERIQKAISRHMTAPMSSDGGISVPARLILYEGLNVDKLDRYVVTAPGGLTESNVLLVNESMELCGIFNLVKDESVTGTFYLTAGSGSTWKRSGNRQYSLLFFRKRDSEYLYQTYYASGPLPPVHIQYTQIPLADLDIRELEPTEAVLAIDFGTSNTTAGAYLHNGYIQAPSSQDLLNGRVRMDAINYVSFPDPSYKDTDWIEVLPTAIGVAECSDPANIRYEFGYEALRSMRRGGYSSRASVFRSMKRWVNNYNKMEEIVDVHGNAAMVSRMDLLRAYMNYIIRTAEHQFKCKFRHVHFTSPVKMKTQFLQMFGEMLPDYRIEQTYALDEGMAVLYNTLADGMERGAFMEGQTYHALVIDCGGGTTDLSSCAFTIEDGHMAYKLDIHTTYENGDTNFGGHNITYRIMQFMKIVFADYYSGRRQVTDIDSLIEAPGADVFRQVDEEGVKSVYQKLEQRYEEAEHIIPTAFACRENRSRDEYLRVRGNFYFLWEIAEEMKQQFFRKTGILRNRFHSEMEGDGDSDLQITTMERWFLSVERNGELKDEYEFPDVVFNIKEITQLIKADIYEVVRKFLDDFYRQGRMNQYSIIKLTGQSCRIDVFREALKEFVPGRSIEFRQKPAEGRVPDLKLACLRGAIRYLSARKTGSVQADITHDAAVIPYTVSAYTHNGREKMLISSLDRSDGIPGSISRPFETAEVELYLSGSDGQLRRKFVYANRPDFYKEVLYEDIRDRYGDKIPQDDTDSIVNGETKFFVFPDDRHWGFHVLPVARRNERLYLGSQKLLPFETDLSELDFFDGMK